MHCSPDAKKQCGSTAKEDAERATSPWLGSNGCFQTKRNRISRGSDVRLRDLYSKCNGGRKLKKYVGEEDPHFVESLLM